MALVEVRVPDIGDFKDVAVIELLVGPGDAIKAEQSLVTVESDKASMEIPSSAAGVVKELKIKLGDKVNQGSLIAVLEGAAAAAVPPAAAPAPMVTAPAAAAVTAAAQPAAAAAGGVAELRVPDIGDFKDVAVIEVFVKPGDAVKLEQSLVTVESDKASMEIPATQAGVIKEVKVRLGDKVSRGSLVALIEPADDASATAAAPAQAPAAAPAAQAATPVRAA
ncbi:MAG TPA: biotin/lipoyl-containing protein, partial [Burkholderiaceae bacterium]|nr:biotin/lipoyl-containing protein [Burkholderiaceae bacterium]